MLKKSIAGVALALGMAMSMPFAGVAQDGTMNIDQTDTVVSQLPDGQEAVEGDWVNSSEVNTVEESSTARAMSQEEKARSAKENDPYGGAVTLIAMCIVVGALVVLSVLFMIFGKISKGLLSKKKLDAQGKTREDVDDSHEDVDSGEAIAAIAMALSEHFANNHDIEDTILTIRRMKRAYSPWNSKIYNIREIPNLHRNPMRDLPVNKNIK